MIHLPFKDAQKARDYDREYQRKRATGGVKASNTTNLPTHDIEIKDAHDLLMLITRAARDLFGRDVDVVTRAKTVAQLVQASTKVLELTNYESRIAALEIEKEEREFETPVLKPVMSN